MAVDRTAIAKSLHLPAGAELVPAGWSWGRLDDVTVGVIDCPHSTPHLTESGPFVARSQDIITGTFRAEQAARVSEATYLERVSRAIPSRGDLLYSREGTYFGIAAEVPENVRVCLGQRMVLIRPKPDVLDVQFLKYWLNSPLMTSHIHGFRDGSVAERLNLPTIRALPVPLPGLREQRRIAHILGTLDDKIELNRQMNETLEAMARALFKSWFVDFDPVRAKMAGRDPGLPKDIADLFPDRLVESELGEIPEGWEIGTLTDLLVLQRGFDLPTKQRTEGAFPVIAASGHNGTHNEAMVRGPGIVTGRSGVLGKVFLELGDFWPLNTTLWVKEFRTVTPCYAYELLGRLDFQQFNAGSAVPTLNRNHVHDLQQVIPSRDSVEAYETISMSLHRRAKENDEQSQILAKLRDILLPKLISGEQRVKDTETYIGRSL